MKFTKTLIFALSISFFNTNLTWAQCSSANMQSHNGGVIHCNFPQLAEKDVEFYTKKLNQEEPSAWIEERINKAKQSPYQWKTKNLKVLMMTNHADIISVAQLNKLKHALNLYLVDIADANKDDKLESSHMPIVEEIILEEYPAEFKNLFDAVGFLVFADPDQRNGDTGLSEKIRKLAMENDVNVVINLIDAPLDIPFKGAAQVYCENPGPYMNIAIKKDNTIALSDKYLNQLAIAVVHGLGHTNFANHQSSLREKEESNQCHEENYAFEGNKESMMFNADSKVVQRKEKEKPFGSFWQKDNAQVIIESYIQRGLLLPLFDYAPADEKQEEARDNKTEINLFPNPVNQLLTIELVNDINFELSVYNIGGNLIQKQQLESFVTQLDVSNFDAGTYILEFFCEGTGERIVKKMEKID